MRANKAKKAPLGEGSEVEVGLGGPTWANEARRAPPEWLCEIE